MLKGKGIDRLGKISLEGVICTSFLIFLFLLVIVYADANVTITKTALNSPVNCSQTIQFLINVTNNNSYNLTNLIVNDTTIGDQNHMCYSTNNSNPVETFFSPSQYVYWTINVSSNSSSLIYVNFSTCGEGNGTFTNNVTLSNNSGVFATTYANFTIESCSGGGGGLNINLSSPSDGETLTSLPFLFTYNMTGSAMGSINCSLWANFTGSWSENQTSTNVTFGQNNFSSGNLSDGAYIWNVFCTNGTINSSAMSNRTFSVNIQPSSNVSAVKYLQNSTVNCSSTIQFTINVTNNNSYNLTDILVNDTGIGSSIYYSTNNSNPHETYFFAGQYVAWRINVSNQSTFQILVNFTTGSTNGNYTNYINITNSSGSELAFAQGNYTIIGNCNEGEGGGINVSLTSPLDGATLTTPPFIFNYSVTGSGPVNCTLWDNFSGPWAANQTSTNVTMGGDQNNSFSIENLSSGVYGWNVLCTNGTINASAPSNRTFSVLGPVEAYFTNVPSYPDDYLNVSGKLMIFTAGAANIDGYANGTNFTNWTIKLYQNGTLLNSSLCFGNSSVNGTFCTWNTTQDCSGECENYTLLLNATDSNGNFDSHSIIGITIDNVAPNISIINSTVNLYDWTVRANVSENYINDVEAFVINENNSLIMYWAHICNESSGGNCNGSGTGVSNITWGFDRYQINGTFVPISFELNSDVGNDSYAAGVQGCFDQSGTGNYDCGGMLPNGKEYGYYLIYNFSANHSNTNSSLVGIGSEQWCSPTGGGCALNTTIIQNGTSKFMIQEIKFNTSSNEWTSTNLSNITLYSIGSANNQNLTFVQANESNYTFVFEVQDYANHASFASDTKHISPLTPGGLNATLNPDVFSWQNINNATMGFTENVVNLTGYVNETNGNLANWTLKLYSNGVLNRTLNNGTTPVNGTLYVWNTTQDCAGECENYTFVLNATDIGGNSATQWIYNITIDNLAPQINIINISVNGSNVFARANITEKYLYDDSAYIFDENNSVVVGWGRFCGENQPDACQQLESGFYNRSWNSETFLLNNTLISAYMKFGFNNLNDTSTISVPGCFDQSGTGNYDCGGNCENQSICRTYRWWLVYNDTNHDGRLLGLTNEQLCGQNGCALNTTVIQNENSSFKVQRDYFNFTDGVWNYPNATQFKLYSIGGLNNTNLTVSNLNGSYNFAFQAQDYAGWSTLSETGFSVTPSQGPPPMMLNVFMLNSGDIHINDTIRFLINVTNAGQENITNLTLSYYFNGNMNYTSASLTPTSINYTTVVAYWNNISVNLAQNQSYALYVNFTALNAGSGLPNDVEAIAYYVSGSNATNSNSFAFDIMPPGWTMYRYDYHHSAQSGENINLTNFGLRWTYNTTDGQDTDVAVSNGVVYAHSWGGQLYALNLTNGQKLWNYTVGGSASSPTISGSKIYVSGDTSLYAINFDGTLNCIFSGAGSSGSPVVYNGVVYIGTSYFGASNYIYAINATNCAQIGNYSLSGTNYTESSAAVDNNMVFIATNEPKLYALNVSNISQTIWSYALADSGSGVGSSPVIDNGIVYMIADKLYEFNETSGTLLRNTSTQINSTYSVPTIWNGIIYVGASDAKLYALYASNNSVKWNTNPLCSGGLVCSLDGSPAISANGIVFMNVMSDVPTYQYFYAFNATNGNQLWNHTIDADSYSEIAISNETVFMGTGDGILYAFGTQQNDTTYPIFSNYQDNNGTLTNSGTALFNVTVENTNGTVILRINDSSYLATNLIANVYNVSVVLTSGTYFYNWSAYGNGSSHLVNYSSLRSYTVETTLPVITIQSPANASYSIQSIWFNATVNNATSLCWYSLDGAANVSLTNSSGNWNGLNSSVTNGHHSVIFYCNDTYGNVGFTSLRYFTVDNVNPVASLGTNPVDYYNSNSSSMTFDFKCSDNIGVSTIQLWSNFSGTWSANYSNSNYANDTWLNITLNNIPSGIWKWGVFCNDSAGNTNWTTNRTVMVDTIYPQFINSTTSPATGGNYNSSMNYLFNVTITNTNGTAGIEFNGTNYSLSNSSNNFYKTFSNLGAGTYSYYYWAFGTGINNRYNASQAYSYTINKATPTLTKSINGIDNNLTLTYPQQINASATTNAGTLKIYMNDSEITNGQNYSLAAGYYRFDFNVTGNENYTNTYGTLYVTINKASGDISLLLNGTAGNLSLVYGSSVNASIGTLYGSATLYRNGTNVTTENNQNITLAAGYYNYTAYSTGNQNYSSATISRFVNITKATPPLSCSGSSNTYPASISFSGSGCPTQGASDVTCSLTNPTPAGCPSCSGSSCSILCTAGTYNSTYATSGDQNWSSYTSTSCSATENKGSPTLSLTPSKNITYGAVAGMTGSTSDTGNADCIYTLYRNGSAYGNGTSVTDNTVLAVGLYLYAYNTSGCANYTTTANSSSLTVNKANDSLNLSLNGEVNQNISVVYPATITAIGYSLSNTDQVYRNGTLINESIAEPLGMGTYVYKINSTGNTNYNANSTGLTYYAQVNQTSSSVNLLINGNDSNASVMVEQNVNITASRTSGEGIINLYEDGQLINNGTSTLTNTTSYMAEGTHNITVFYSATQNYTASSKTHFITVIDNVPPVVSLQSPANDTWNNSLTLLYAYYANDTHSGLQNCSFYFDNTLKQTNSSVTKGNNQFNYTGTAGIHNWYITCYDNSSQKNGKTSDSWIIKLDNLSPTTTILGVANTTYASNVSITFSASDNGDSGLNRTEYNLTGACSSGWANYTSAINCGNEGSTTVYYRSIDNAGNIETTNALAFSIDKTGPLVTITSPSNGANISGTISFNATAIDNGINASHVVFKIDSTALTDDLTPPFSTTLTTTSYADGTHTLTAVAYDNVGNANSTNITIFTDNTKPNSTIIYPSNNFLTKANVTINATATDTGVGVDYVEIYNGTVWKNATHSGSVWTYNISFGTAGTYNIKSRATDKLGNQETPSGGINVIVDNVPPTISNINANPNPVSNATSLSISVVASDTNGVSSVNATLNGTTTALNSSGGTTYSSSLISPSTEGAYNLTILAVDNAGNSVNNSLYQVDVNASTPIITITPVNGAAITNGTSITINVSNAQTVQYNTTSNTTLTTISGNSTTVITAGAEGNYTVYVWANTSSGTQANKSNTYIIDNTPPIIYVNAVTTPTNIISQNISGNVTEANLDYVTVNGNLTNLNGNNYYRVVSLNEGNNTINMTAYDKAGQSNSTIRYVFLDTLTPTTTHSISGTLGENGWYTSDIILTLTVDDGSQSSGYTASYDSGAGFVTYSSPITLNETSTIIYRTIDNADNAESNKTTGQIKIDKEAPLITNVTFSTSLPAVNEPLTIRANITDSNALAAQQNISIDETNYSMTLESADIYKYDFTPTQSKNYSVIIYGKDIAGNYATQAESFNVGESKSENWEFSNTTTTDRNYTSTVDTQLNISVNASVTGNITVLLFTSQPDIANTSLSNAVKYVDVNLSNNINDVLQWILIKVYYNTSEISGLNESTLKLAWYNVSSGTWVTLAKGTPDWVNDAGVDTVNHYVWVNVTHLSLYGLTGTNVTTTPPSFTTSSSGGSGGGGGGGGASTGISVSLAKGNANITVSSISAGNMTNVTIAKYQDIAFRQINISVLNSVNNIKIVITKLPSLPASVNHDISGKVYHYIQVDNTNFTDNDLSKVYIKFAVNKTWLTDNGVDFSNISLYRWTNNRWNELTTTFLSNDSYEDFYQAESPGLSYFLIGTKGGEVTVTPCIENWSCTDWSACINNQQTRTCMDANACGTTVSKPVESQNCISTAAVSGVASWVYPSIAIVIIIIIVVLLFVFRKKIIPTSSKISEKK